MPRGWRIVGAATVAACALGVALPAAAQEQVAILKPVKPADLEAIFKARKYQFDPPETTASKKQLWRLTVGDREIVVISGGQDMQLGYMVEQKVAYRKVNEWNRTKRYAKLWVMEDEVSVLLDQDLDFAEGASREQIEASFDLFLELVKLLDEFLGVEPGGTR